MSKIVRRVLAGLVALAFITAGAAYAAGTWTLKQLPKGGLVIENTYNDAQVGVGDTGLQLSLANLSSASTIYVASVKPGKIVAYWVNGSAAFSAGSAAPTISVFTCNSSGHCTQVGSGDTVQVATGQAGPIGSDTSVTDSNADVTQGQTIAVHTDGNGTGTVIGNVTIQID